MTKTILLCLILVSLFMCVACVFNWDYGKMTQEEQQVASDLVKEYYSEIPDILNGHLTEDSQKDIEECIPEYNLFGTPNYKKLNDHNYGMREFYALELKNRYLLCLDYIIIKENRIASHIGGYHSPKFTCSSLEGAIEGIKEHIPPFDESSWIQDVFCCFYPEGTDISKEWMDEYQKMVNEISKNDFMADDGSVLYQVYYPIMSTEYGEYNFLFTVRFWDFEESNSWQYSYEIRMIEKD